MKKNEQETISIELCVNVTYNNVDASLETEELANRIAKLLYDTLTPREQDIVEKRIGFYGSTQTFKEIAEFHFISEERARQIYNKALRKLRRPNSVAMLAEFI